MDKEMDRLAEMCRAKREMQLVSSDFDLSDSTGSKMKLYDFLNALANGDVHNQYTRCLRYIDDYPEGTTIKLRDVTTEWLAKFQSYLLGKELMPSTVRLYMNLLKSAFNQAVKERKLVSNPTRGLPTIKVPQTLKDILTIEDIRKLDVVYSTEKPIKPLFDIKEIEKDTSRRSVPGSSAFVPPAAGLTIASFVTRKICGLD